MIFTVVVIRLLGSAVFIRGLGWVEGQGGSNGAKDQLLLTAINLDFCSDRELVVNLLRTDGEFFVS